MYYSRKNRIIDYLSKVNLKHVINLRKEVESNNPDDNKIDYLVSVIEINIDKMTKLQQQILVNSRLRSNKN
ncbi:MAG: hypothetical protein ACI35W_01410 [Anaeroplasmataceae bacterium]